MPPAVQTAFGEIPGDLGTHQPVQAAVFGEDPAHLGGLDIRRAGGTQDHPRRIQSGRAQIVRAGRRQAGPVDHDQAGQLEDSLRLVPTANLPGRVPAQHQEEFGGRVPGQQLGQGVDRVGGAGPSQLQVGDLQPGQAGCRQPGHLVSVLGRRFGRPAMWWAGRGDQQQAIQSAAVEGGRSNRAVAEVDGIEGYSYQPDALAHPGWYSNSSSPIRTVSPGSTPAASSAAVMPRRWSWTWNQSKEWRDSRSVRAIRLSARSPTTS